MAVATIFNWKDSTNTRLRCPPTAAACSRLMLQKKCNGVLCSSSFGAASSTLVPPLTTTTPTAPPTIATRNREIPPCTSFVCCVELFDRLTDLATRPLRTPPTNAQRLPFALTTTTTTSGLYSTAASATRGFLYRTRGSLPSETRSSSVPCATSRQDLTCLGVGV